MWEKFHMLTVYHSCCHYVQVCKIKKLGINTTTFHLQNYLPSTGDWQLLRSRMEHVVKKILCKYFPQFSDMEVKDITHQYSEISERKSEIVSESIQTIFQFIYCDVLYLAYSLYIMHIIKTNNTCILNR